MPIYLFVKENEITEVALTVFSVKHLCPSTLTFQIFQIVWRRGHRGGAYSFFCKALMPIYLFVKENEITEVALTVFSVKHLCPSTLTFQIFQIVWWRGHRGGAYSFFCKALMPIYFNFIFQLTICKYLDSKPLTIFFLKHVRLIKVSCINNITFRNQKSHVCHHIFFNVNNSYWVKIFIWNTFINHINGNYPQFILRNYGNSKSFICTYIAHKHKYGFSK